jgi:hypothetical protein
MQIKFFILLVFCYCVTYSLNTIKYVNTDTTGIGNGTRVVDGNSYESGYLSLHDAEDSLDNEISANDTVTIHLYGEDSDFVVFKDWATYVTINLIGHDYTLQSSLDGTIAIIDTVRMNMSNITFRNVGNTDRSIVINISTNLVKHTIDKCIVDGGNVSNIDRRGIYASSRNGSTYITNCVIYNINSHRTNGSYNSAIVNAYGVLRVYNSTIIGGNYGIHEYGSPGVTVVKNCYVGGAYTECINTVIDTIVTCASSDTTGSSGLQNIEVNSAGFSSTTEPYDYHITESSVLRLAGTSTISESYPLNCLTDIDNDLRIGTFDIGADQVIVMSECDSNFVDNQTVHYTDTTFLISDSLGCGTGYVIFELDGEEVDSVTRTGPDTASFYISTLTPNTSYSARLLFRSTLNSETDSTPIYSFITDCSTDTTDGWPVGDTSSEVPTLTSVSPLFDTTGAELLFIGSNLVSVGTVKLGTFDITLVRISETHDTIYTTIPDSIPAGVYTPIIQWSGGADSIVDGFEVIAISDTTDPWYIPPEYTITLNTVGLGTVNQSPSGSTHDSGTVIHFTATPNEGWSFSGYSGSLTSTDSIDSIVLSSNINITATFTSNFTIDSLRAIYNYRGWTFSIWCDNANALTSTDSIFLGDTFINTVGNLRVHDGLINVPIPSNMPSNWYKVSINDIEFVDDSIRVFIPKWGN